MKERDHYLTTIEWFNLNTCIQPICRMFAYNVFLVGSCLYSENYRDVDIRIIIGNYGEWFENTHHRKVFGMLMSEWLSSRTNLPIDLQIQTLEEAAKFPGVQLKLGVNI